jgi:hypothetical protein
MSSAAAKGPTAIAMREGAIKAAAELGASVPVLLVIGVSVCCPCCVGSGGAVAPTSPGESEGGDLGGEGGGEGGDGGGGGLAGGAGGTESRTSTGFSGLPSQPWFCVSEVRAVAEAIDSHTSLGCSGGLPARRFWKWLAQPTPGYVASALVSFCTPPNPHQDGT